MKNWTDAEFICVVIGIAVLVFGIIYLMQDQWLSKNFADMVYTIGK